MESMESKRSCRRSNKASGWDEIDKHLDEAAREAVKAARKVEIRNADDGVRREVFVAAVERLGIRTVDAPALFGVDRRTFTRWTSGVSRIPLGVFLAIVQLDNKVQSK